MTDPAPGTARITPSDVVESVRDGLMMLALYLSGTFVLLSLVLVWQGGSGFPISWIRGTAAAGALGLRGEIYAQYAADGSSSSDDSSDLSGVFDFGTIRYGFTPLLLLTLAVGLALFIGRRQEQGAPSRGTREAVVRALLTAAAAVAGLVVLTKLAGLPLDTLDDETLSDSGVSIGPVVLYGLPTLTAAFAVGRLHQMWRARQSGTLRQELAVRTRGVSTWVGTTAVHALVSSIGFTIAGIVYILLSSQQEISEGTDSFTGDDASGLVLFLYAIPNMALAATGFFQGFSISFGAAGFGGGGESVGLFAGHVPAQHYLWALIALASAVAVGARRSLQEPHITSTTEGWWQAGIGSVVFWAVAALFLQVHFGSGLFDASVGYSVPVLVPVAFAWGVGILVLGRVAAPTARSRFPALAERVRPMPMPTLPPAVDPVGGEPPATAEVISSPPANPVSRRTVLTALIGIAALVLAFAGFKVLGSKFYGPESVAKAYLEDISSGDVSGALSHLSVRPSDMTLLSAGVLPAADRITQPRVGSIQRNGSTALVEITYVVGDEEQEDTLTLVQSGTRAGVFHDWKVRGGLGDLSVEGDGSLGTLTLNGVTVNAGDSHPAFPGVYEIEIGSDIVTSDTGTVFMSFTDVVERIQAQLTTDAEQKAVEAVTAYYTACLAKATTLDTTCGFNAYQFADRFEGIRWTLDPVSGLDVSYDDGEVSVSGSVGAHVTGTAISSDFLGGFTREPISDDDTEYISGTVTFTGGVAQFRP